MKILHLTGWPIPETIGGTEVFIASLCRALNERHVDSVIGCLDELRAGSVAEYCGIPIHRFAPVTEWQGKDAQIFSRWLSGINPDLVHIHAYVTGLGTSLVHVATQSGYPVVFTAHVPGIVCPRGTMLRYGRIVCDGQMLISRCSPCYLQKRGLPLWAGHLLNFVPEQIRVGLASPLKGRAATALRLPLLLRQQFEKNHDLFSQCQRVIVVCQWLYDALKKNGVPETKLVLSRQATDLPANLAPRSKRTAGEPLRVGYLGRYDSVKGVEVLVRAVTELPVEVPIRLILHGAAQGDDERQLLERLRSLAASDRRITLNGPLNRNQLADFFAGIDVLAVPSTWMETGPIVVYEALAHCTPVLGSNLGGIPELIRNGKDGWLLPPNDTGAWRRKLQELCLLGHALPEMRSPSPILRNWDQVAQEMQSVYQSVLNGRKTG